MQLGKDTNRNILRIFVYEFSRYSTVYFAAYSLAPESRLRYPESTHRFKILAAAAVACPLIPYEVILLLQYVQVLASKPYS